MCLPTVFNTTEKCIHVFLSVESAGHQNGKDEGLFLLSNNAFYMRGLVS